MKILQVSLLYITFGSVSHEAKDKLTLRAKDTAASQSCFHKLIVGFLEQTLCRSCGTENTEL